MVDYIIVSRLEYFIDVEVSKMRYITVLMSKDLGDKLQHWWYIIYIFAALLIEYLIGVTVSY